MADDTTQPAKPCPFAAKVAHDIATAPVERRVFRMGERIGYTEMLKMVSRVGIEYV